MYCKRKNEQRKGFGDGRGYEYGTFVGDVMLGRN